MNSGDYNPLPRAADEQAKPSDSIFAEIGAQLRRRRGMLSLTYEEIERHIHVRPSFLQGLEEGALEALPSPVQTRGILANYAGFLDLDVDSILLQFADGLQARHREFRPEAAPRSRPPMTVNTSLPPLRTFIASDLLFGGGMAIMLVLFAVWGISRVITVRSAVPARGSSPSISDILAGTPLPTLEQQVTLIPGQAAVEPTLGSTFAVNDLPRLSAGSEIELNIAATSRTYMRITVDGKVQFEGRVETGLDYAYHGASQIEVLTGNAAALKITFNTHDLGLMGRFGEVADRIYTAQGIVTPTLTPAPTRTPTPNMTATPSETPTRTPSVTPTPKPGG